MVSSDDGGHITSVGLSSLSRLVSGRTLVDFGSSDSLLVCGALDITLLIWFLNLAAAAPVAYGMGAWSLIEQLTHLFIHRLIIYTSS